MDTEAALDLSTTILESQVEALAPEWGAEAVWVGDEFAQDVRALEEGTADWGDSLCAADRWGVEVGVERVLFGEGEAPAGLASCPVLHLPRDRDGALVLPSALAGKGASVNCEL